MSEKSPAPAASTEENHGEEPMKMEFPSIGEPPATAPAAMESIAGMEKQKSTIEEDKGAATPAATKTVSHVNMTHLFTQFRDDAQLKKLEEMLEYIKTEVEKSRERIKKLDDENALLRKKFKDQPF